MNNYIRNSNTLSLRDIYKLMQALIKQYYFQTYSDDIGSLAGSMKLACDEDSTLDPAIWYDWLEAINGARSPVSAPSTLTLEEGYNAAIKFFTRYANQMESKDIELFIKQLTFEKWMEINERNKNKLSEIT